MKSIKTFTIVILLVFSGSFLTAQDSTQTTHKDEFNPFTKNYIKFSPFTLLELEPSIQIGYEYSASPKIRIQHELGYVGLFNPAYAIFQWNSNFTNLISNGVRVRTTIKFPLKLDNMDTRVKYKYFGIDVMFKYLETTEKDVSIRRMQAYWEVMDITTEKYVGAIHMIYGINNYISYANNIIYDSYFGLGVRYKVIKDNAPYDVSYGNRPWWDDMDGMMISVMLGLKFGVGI